MFNLSFFLASYAPFIAATGAQGVRNGMDLEACILNSPLLEQSAESMKSTANCRPISIAGYCKDLALHLIGVSHPNIKSWLGTEFLETDLATLIDNNRKNHGLSAVLEE